MQISTYYMHAVQPSQSFPTVAFICVAFAKVDYSFHTFISIIVLIMLTVLACKISFCTSFCSRLYTFCILVHRVVWIWVHLYQLNVALNYYISRRLLMFDVLSSIYVVAPLVLCVSSIGEDASAFDKWYI